MKSKAIFLLFTFLLNYLVGFACTLHDEIRAFQKNEAAYVHSSHNHPESSHKHDDHQYENNGDLSSLPEEAAPQTIGNRSSEAHNCCSDEISKFDSLSKISTQSSRIITDIVLADFVPIKFHPFVSTGQLKGFVKYFSNRQRPPNIDIRILIQSFQV